MRLKELREERGLTQSDVANAIQTSQSNIARWEKELNEPSASFVIKLADFFEVSTDYLLGRADDFENIAVSATKNQLSVEEERLLYSLRKLNKKNKTLVLAYVRVRLEEQEENG